MRSPDIGTQCIDHIFMVSIHEPFRLYGNNDFFAISDIAFRD